MNKDTKTLPLAVGLLIGAVLGMFIHNSLQEKPKQIEKPMAHDHMMHDHKPVVVPIGSAVPSVEMEVTTDEAGNALLQLTTENFTFAPQSVDKPHVPNEGHAHLYINDKKSTRLYGNWYHIHKDLLTEKKNTIRVTLNSNNHGELTYNGKTIEAITHLETSNP